MGRHHSQSFEQQEILRVAHTLRKEQLEKSKKQTGLPQWSSSLHHIVGDFGVTLFSPLDVMLPTTMPGSTSEESSTSFECRSKTVPCERQPTEETTRDDGSACSSIRIAVATSDETDRIGLLALLSLDESSSSSCTSSLAEQNDYDNDIHVGHLPEHFLIQEPRMTLEATPPILSESLLHEIVTNAIPYSLRMYQWQRVFSIARDGDAFWSMAERCRSFQHTLIVIKTTNGTILGGFASEKWIQQDGFGKKGRGYFGSGVCFLFSSHSNDTVAEDKKQQTGTPLQNKTLQFYPWTGENDYCQICDVDAGKIAMGGGEGDFGLIVGAQFLRGSTGYCATFQNPPLVPGDGNFDILDFEVYGLVRLVSSQSSGGLSSRLSMDSLLSI